MKICDFVNSGSGKIDPVMMALFFNISVKEIASLTGVPYEILSHQKLYSESNVQKKLRNCLEVFIKIIPWSANKIKAYAWYRSEGLPEFGGLTIEQLVKQGRMDSVRRYLAHTSDAGFS